MISHISSESDNVVNGMSNIVTSSTLAEDSKQMSNSHHFSGYDRIIDEIGDIAASITLAEAPYPTRLKQQQGKPSTFLTTPLELRQHILSPSSKKPFSTTSPIWLVTTV